MKNKIGVYICMCGSNISDYVNVEKVREEATKVDGVHIAKITMFACSDSTQQEIANDIKEQNLDAIVVASCSPKLHLFTFRNVAIQAGLNPYNYVQVNIREQGSWAHSDNKPKATEKAIQLVLGGIARVKYSNELESVKIHSENSAAVVGAGVAGMRAALELADMGTKVHLIEREYFVGGRTSQWNVLFTTNETGQQVVSRLYDRIITNPNITLYTSTSITSKKGSVGDFTLTLTTKPRYVKKECKLDKSKFLKAIEICPVEVDDEFNFGITKRKAIFKNYDSEFPEIPAIDYDNCTKCGECLKICDEIDFNQEPTQTTINVGAILLSTGFNPYEPPKGEFGYGEIENVITLQQFKRLIELSPERLAYKGREIKNIAYIYCVGSRQVEGENKYCSRYCCTSVIHTAILAKQKYGGINNFHFTRGIRTYGKQEILYHQASEQGDIFLQSFEDSPSRVEKNGADTVVKINDILTANEEVEVTADLVVLVTGMTPRENSDIINLLKVPVGRDKFFNEVHPKLRPVETVIDGILISGACQAPLNVTESVKSALAASSKVNSLISKGEIELEPTMAVVHNDKCTWCGKCAEACPYDAISVKEHSGKQVAEVSKALCKGCGMCLPVCPEDALDLIGYTDKEMESMIEALIS
ncbi:MAG TPA: CoB--CoM heterodisulfide reductase iron-sulfur subunit A family protein [Tenuifilaceae bacterium]|mgnify:CR=1 FL=1|nr:CoB--CoM heterodisulfide reductase iron-sulfur subunit A family protein [Tenuifilaceae bacterium]HPE18412.1 CoB--CoM heterodisulfide reductase iron-sulfur subunit A family protein [Tenuifilaceae bacterium]HPJ46235.1 CoB--CoM heterodisulfide reductase iron-sulfur subunit A family protein [Tenuifilaceae bacterium]HPQ33857.1 CoB--CoM heterodisulfide reductase iron-sulfur subunit A family protein [Tenuifilaceae bacterium]HRX67701.1 CoB--CoM heterodisulfide reductase iron-sulfur subunit A family 